MDSSLKFDKRVRTIARKNRRLARGYTTYIDEMGVLRKKQTRQGPQVPVRGLILLTIGFTMFKAFVLVNIGRAAYDLRIDTLNSGTIFEQAGAWMLQVDPLTRFAAGLLSSVI